MSPIASKGRTGALRPSVTGRLAAAAIVSVSILCAAGCQRLINGPQKEDADQVRPDQIVNFDTLYGENCAACHGADGHNGPAIPMNNPEYMALVSDDQLRSVTENGQTGTLMPAFAQSAGGLLTEKQISVIVSGMRERWGKPMPGLNMPPYAAHTSGDVAHGQQVYTAACASCHGPANQTASADSTSAQSELVRTGMTQPKSTASGPANSGSIVDPVFLALLSDQSLRTSLSPGVRTSASPIGEGTFRATRCPTRRLPMWSPGCPVFAAPRRARCILTLAAKLPEPRRCRGECNEQHCRKGIQGRYAG